MKGSGNKSCIQLGELANFIHPFRGSRKHMAMWEFYSDLSYDGSPLSNAKGAKHLPNTYVVAGILTQCDKWKSIVDAWDSTNADFKVPRYHAAHLNGRTHEYKGWTADRALDYSTRLLGVLSDSGPLMIFISGVHADCLRQILSEKSRRKLGNPYQLCFNSCIASIASTMDQLFFHPADKFSVVVDQDNGYEVAIKSFVEMKSNLSFANRLRLGTCTPGNMEEIIELQTADLIAYEWFKWFNTRGRQEGNIRPILVSLVKRHPILERYWDEKNILLLRDRIESEVAEDGQLIIVPPM